MRAVLLKAYAWWCSRVRNDERGQGMVEYALILALVSVVAILLLTNIGGEIRRIFQDVLNGLTSGTP